ncbi:MAG: RNA 2',3'-cyclic phosphodiesterase [Bacteroidetes bacterium]|nr:MAG: RNA 2',3'-cyclic phosphodiesterase [Bacteroidota bacterium]
MKKTFLAIRIPVTIEIESYLTDYKRDFEFVDMRWNEAKYLHLTLKYFGPTSEKRIKRIQRVLSELLKEEKSFEINIVKLGVFGSRYAPKVIWWGIDEEELLKELFTKIEIELSKIGIYADRQNFVPHITLGRIEYIVSKPFFQRLMQKHKKVEEINVKVDSIVLLESKRVGDGVEYNELVKFEI